MDDPIQDCSAIVHTLTQGSPKEQEDCINTYFTPDASFTHPFCRTGSFNGSRYLIHSIFRWYKIMSPQIDLKINGIAYDEANLILYINISQVFAIWFIPFHRAPVTLTTQLQVVRPPNSRKYYIQSQNDLYQVTQFVRFFAPWGVGDAVVLFWHIWATLFCTVLAYVFTPFLWLEQRWADKQTTPVEGRFMGFVEGVEGKRMHGNGIGNRTTKQIAVQAIGQMEDGLDEDNGELSNGFGGSDAGGGGDDEKGDRKPEQFGKMQVISSS